MPENTKTIVMDSSSLIEWVGLFGLDYKNTSPSELVEYALPGFFNIDFKLKDIELIKLLNNSFLRIFSKLINSVRSTITLSFNNLFKIDSSISIVELFSSKLFLSEKARINL